MVIPKYHIAVIGSGGTGTYFLKEVSRYIAHLPLDKRELIAPDMYVIDGDIVEEKNLDRQAFIKEDIGFKKSTKMAEILNDTYFDDSTPWRWKSIPEYLLELNQLSFLPKTDEEEMRDKLKRGANATVKINIPLIISCVDNHAARLLLEEYFRLSNSCILFDSANEWENGEAVFAYKLLGKVLAPVRSHYFPDIKEGDLRTVTEMSCTELNSTAPQHIFTNMYAALQLLSQFSRVIEKGQYVGGFSAFNVNNLSNQFYEYKKGGPA